MIGGEIQNLVSKDLNLKIPASNSLQSWSGEPSGAGVSKGIKSSSQRNRVRDSARSSGV